MSGKVIITNKKNGLRQTIDSESAARLKSGPYGDCFEYKEIVEPVELNEIFEEVGQILKFKDREEVENETDPETYPE